MIWQEITSYRKTRMEDLMYEGRQHNSYIILQEACAERDAFGMTLLQSSSYEHNRFL